MDDAISKKIDAFFKGYKKRYYKKKELLIRARDMPSGIFYLKNGYVRKYAISKKGDELVVNIFKPISFFPMSWAINSPPNEYFYEAMTDLDVWRAPREDVVAFIKSNPDVLYNLLSRVYKGTDGMETRMVSLMADNAYAQLITELIIEAKRFGKKEENVVQITVSEKDLAAQCGMTRETVSRQIKILKEKNLITFNKKVLTIKDLKKLKEQQTQ